jgi:hypothetical protein
MRRCTITMAFSIALFFANSFAQPTDDWVRVQTDDGSFSVEVPEQHKYFFNDQAFSISWQSSSYQLRDMSLLTAYHDKSLVSFEVYDGDKQALNAMYERDKKRDWVEDAKTKIGGVEVRSLSRKEGGGFGVAKYFRVGKKIFVVIAASRDTKTPVIERFINSIEVRAKDSDPKLTAAATPFSKLVKTDIDIEYIDPAVKSATPAPPLMSQAAGNDPTVKRFQVLRAPNPSYVDSARQSRAKGVIRIRMLFAADGFVPKVEILKTLPDGLLRQALFSAIRLRYLPQEKDGRPVDIKRTVDFSFDIY